MCCGDCEDETRIRASAQCIKALNNMRAVRCLSSQNRSAKHQEGNVQRCRTCSRRKALKASPGRARNAKHVLWIRQGSRKKNATIVDGRGLGRFVTGTASVKSKRQSGLTCTRKDISNKSGLKKAGQREKKWAWRKTPKEAFFFGQGRTGADPSSIEDALGPTGLF